MKSLNSFLRRVGGGICSLALFLSAVLAQSASSPGTNPAYASYDFGTPDKVVVFGSQPLGIIAGVVPELMRRDRVLAEQLHGLGLELRVLPFYNGPDINHFMHQGKVTAAMAGDFPTFAFAATGESQIVAIAKRDKAAVVTDKRFQSLKDLIGKKIAFPEGTSSHLGLLVVMEAAGLKEEQFTMLPMSIDQLTPAINAGQIDAFAGWEPVPTSALAENKNLRIISQFLNTDFLYWRSDFPASHLEASRCILAAYSRAIIWMNKGDANLANAASWALASMQSFSGVGKELPLSLEKMKSRLRENLALLGSAFIPATEFADSGYLQGAFVLLKSKGRLPQSADWKRVQDSVRADILKKINTERAKYQIAAFDYVAN